MNISRFFSLIKARGKKDTAKLVKKVVTDKRGRRMTVWVKPDKKVGDDFWNVIASFFGKGKMRIVKREYKSNDIEKKFGVPVERFRLNFLAYFKSKDRWDQYFSSPEPRPQMLVKFKGEKIDAFRVFNKMLMEWMSNNYKTMKMKEASDGTRADVRKPDKRAVPADMPKAVAGGASGDAGGDVPSRRPSRDEGQTVLNGGNIGERSSDDLRLTKGQIKKIRETCMKILEKPDSEITEADKAILREYEGGGSVAQGERSADEILYAYYTPKSVVSKMWELAKKYIAGKTAVDVLEPAAGTGRFADMVPQGVSAKFDMFEIDDVSSRINRILHPDANVKKESFETLFMEGRSVKKKYDGKKYDLVIGNPPYGAFTGQYKGLGEGKGHSRYEEYFMDRGLDTLKDGGVMAFIVPSDFMRNWRNSKIKEKIAMKGKIMEAWRLPNGTFNTTGVGTDVIVIRKEKGNINDFLGDQYFKDNPGNVLGVETTRTGRYNRIEKWINPPEGVALMDVFNLLDANKYPFVVPGARTMPEEVRAKIGVALEGNQNAVGPHDVEPKPKSPEKKKKKGGKGKAESKTKKKDKGVPEPIVKKETMNVDQFNAKYGRNVSALDLAVSKATGFDGVVDMALLSPEDKKAFQKNPNMCMMGGQVYHAVNYVSGNIYDKLDQLERDREAIGEGAYAKQKKMLESALPPKRTVADITLSPITEFAQSFEFGEGEDRITLIQKFWEWAGVNKWNPRWQNFNGNVSSYDIPPGLRWANIVDYIEGKAVGISAPKGSSDERKAQAKAESDMVKDKRMKAAETIFKRFIETGLQGEEKEAFEREYNRVFNSHVDPDYSKIPVSVNGVATTFKTDSEGNPIPLELRESQLRGVSFLSNKGNGVLAYEVGLGKTMTGIIATVNQIQTGRAHKPLICVPKATYKNWLREIKELFPNQKVNELGNLGKSEIGKFLTPDGRLNLPPDALNVCTVDALRNISFKKESLDEIMADLVDSQKVQESEEDEDAGYYGRRRNKKDKRADQQAAEIKSIEEKLGRASKTGSATFYIEDLGIDHITLDEAHFAKNIFGQAKVPVTGRNITINEYSGMTGGTSGRALKTYAITQYIQRHNNDRNVFALTATPFTNSAIEIYNMLSLVARKRLKELGIYNMHEFLSHFADVKTEWVVKGNQKIEKAPVCKNFKNTKILQSLIREYFDKKTIKDAGIKRPDIERHFVDIPMTEDQRYLQEIERLRFDTVSKETPGAALKAIHNMRMSLISPSLIEQDDHNEGVNLHKDGDPVEHSPKMKFCLDSAAKLYKKKPDMGQILYVPIGTDLFDKYTKYLVKNGVPADAIGIIHSEINLNKREDIIESFNDPEGKVKVLIGTDTIGEGINLNGNTGVLYDTMLQWNPSQRVQLEGRLWRFGNKQKKVHVVYPLMVDSVDAAMNQKHDEKMNRINDIFSYTGDKMELGDISPEDLKFDLIKDPKKRAEFRINRETEEIRNKEYELRLSADLIRKKKDTHENAENTISFMKERIEKAEKEIADYNTMISGLEKELKDAPASDKARIQSTLERYKQFRNSERETITESKAQTKKAVEIQAKIAQELQDMGNLTLADVETKAKSLEAEAEGVKAEIEKVKEKFPVYVEEAKAELIEKKKTVKPVDESIAHYVDYIAKNTETEELVKAITFSVGGAIMRARVLTKEISDGKGEVIFNGKKYLVRR
ncbi:MAG TPA: helicase-related protein [Spirochaetota bacterium]|nr:helicase-related protein [Spirochaetota bacterium]